MFGTAWKWMSGGGLGTWFMGGAASFFGIAAYLASRDARIRKDRDRYHELKQLEADQDLTEDLNETTADMRAVHDSPDGVRDYAAEDTENLGPVRVAESDQVP